MIECPACGFMADDRCHLVHHVYSHRGESYASMRWDVTHAFVKETVEQIDGISPIPNIRSRPPAECISAIPTREECANLGRARGPKLRNDWMPGLLDRLVDESKRSKVGPSTRRAMIFELRSRTYAASEIAGSLAGWRNAVLQNGCFRCVVCGSADNLQAHHRAGKTAYPRLRLVVANGIVLCFDCHNRHIHSRRGDAQREAWEAEALAELGHLLTEKENVA